MVTSGSAGLGPNVVGPQVLPPPTMWPTQSLTGWHFCTWLVGWPIAAGWLAISQCQPDPPSRDTWWPSVLLLWSGWPVVRCTLQAETSCGQVWCYDTTSPLGQVDHWSDVPPSQTSYDQVSYYFRSGWPVLFQGKSGSNSHGNSSSMSIH